MPELKVTVSEETITFLREHFPEGISDADRARVAFGVLRYVIESDATDLRAFLREEGLHEIDVEDLYVEALKRALLESDGVDLSDLAALAQPATETDDPDGSADADTDAEDESD